MAWTGNLSIATIIFSSSEVSDSDSSPDSESLSKSLLSLLVFDERDETSDSLLLESL